MATLNLENVVKEYKKWVSMIGEEEGSPDSEVYWALSMRDTLFEHSSELTLPQQTEISACDTTLKAKAYLVRCILPDKSSTPQARAEGRWWWFLNE